MSWRAWQESTLGEQLTFQRGYDITKAEQADGTYPVYSSSGPKSTHAEYKLEGPGVIVGRKGTLGSAFYVEGRYWPHDTTLWVKDFHGNDPKFAYYFVQTMRFEQYDAGASNPSLNRNHIHTIPVNWPPLEEQRRIAGILSAYDDLIENCQRRIRILEEMARWLYREWFVHFRYPGHESTPLQDNGWPAGWESKTVVDSFAVTGGGTPSTKEPEYWEGGVIQWYSPRDITANNQMFIEDSVGHISDLGLAKSSARLFPKRCVMLTSRATIGAVAINTAPACTNQGFITCIPNETVPLYFLYYWVAENVELFERLASGSTFKEISRGVFKTIEFTHPPKCLVYQFENSVAAIADEILNLQRRTSNLRRTRDLLLPRLLGEESIT